MVFVLALVAVSAGCENGTIDETGGASAPFGQFSVVTYNVAGLPETISFSKPTRNHRVIGRRLGEFELALVQEDFMYHHELVAEIRHPYRSTPKVDEPTVFDIGDGLNRFSDLRWEAFERHSWIACHGEILDGADCPSDKGFSLAWTHLAAAAPAVAVVNLHMDSGRSDGDVAARRAQVEQLVEWIGAHVPADAPLIVAGDTNLRTTYPRDAAVLETLMRRLELRDSCTAARCETRHRIDRILFRSGRELALDVVDWHIAFDFVDDAQNPLSDHDPIVARFEWRLVGPGAPQSWREAVAALRSRSLEAAGSVVPSQASE